MKTHFNIDGVHTACGKHIWDNCLDAVEDLAQVDCLQCRGAWNRQRNRWDKEQQDELRQKRTEEARAKKREANIEYIKKIRKSIDENF